MNRRTFLVGIGKFIGAAALIKVPPLIFDVGANYNAHDRELVYRMNAAVEQILKESLRPDIFTCSVSYFEWLLERQVIAKSVYGRDLTRLHKLGPP